jgi:2-polyprenyl-6-methoxyphenol hydroxylase-like FAD-dependent oxidoreductase
MVTPEEPGAEQMTRRCIVVGGGIAGLSAGIAMRKAGYTVALCEQAPKLEPIGAAISIWGNAMVGLDWLGCGQGLRERAVHVRKVLLTQVDGRILFGPVDISACDGWLPHRWDLQEVLLDKLGLENCRLGLRIDDIAETDGKVVVRADGETVDEADLAVVADGIHSAIASRLLGNAPLYRGYGAVIGVGHSPDDDFEPGLAQEIWAERDRFALLDAGDGRRYWFYMAPFERQEDLAAIEYAAIAGRAERWPSTLRAAVERTPAASLIRIPIRSRPIPRALGAGRVICLGDAAHAMEPNQGQGACQGIEDAWLLGSLAQRLPPEAILPVFQKHRLPRVRSYWRDSAIIGRAAHSASRLERDAQRAILAAAPRWLDRRQIVSRHRAPRFG